VVDHFGDGLAGLCDDAAGEVTALLEEFVLGGSDAAGELAGRAADEVALGVGGGEEHAQDEADGHDARADREGVFLPEGADLARFFLFLIFVLLVGVVILFVFLVGGLEETALHRAQGVSGALEEGGGAVLVVLAAFIVVVLIIVLAFVVAFIFVLVLVGESVLGLAFAGFVVVAAVAAGCFGLIVLAEGLGGGRAAPAVRPAPRRVAATGCCLTDSAALPPASRTPPAARDIMPDFWGEEEDC